MSAIVFTVKQADADAYSAAIDVKLGYPRNGVDIGAGIHAPQVVSRTLRYGAVLKHPVLAKWAYFPEDATVDAQGVALPIGATDNQTLDATWFQ